MERSEPLGRLPLSDGSAFEFFRTQLGVRLCREDVCADLRGSGGQATALYSMLAETVPAQGERSGMTTQALTDQASVETRLMDCLGIAEDGEALVCVQKTIAEAKERPDLCGPSLVLLAQEGCDVCDEEKAHHREAIAQGLMQVVDIHSTRGEALAKVAAVEGTPAVLLVDCQDRLIGE